MKIIHKPVSRTLFFSYLIASYCSWIPGYFIDFKKGLPLDNYSPTFFSEVFYFIIAPILTPMMLYAETRLAFFFGLVIPERFLPLITFVFAFVLSWLVLKAKLKGRKWKKENNKYYYVIISIIIFYTVCFLFSQLFFLYSIKVETKTFEENQIKAKANKALEEIEKLKEEIENLKQNQKKLISEQASDYLKNFIKESKTFSAKDWFENGCYFLANEKYQKAIEAFSKTLELDPKNSGIYNNRGNAYSDLKQYEEALQDYDKAIELNPKDSKSFINRGKVYSKLKQFEKAFQDYDKAMELAPKNADVFYNRGITHQVLEQYEKAMSDFDEAIKLNPTFVKTYQRRGITYLYLKKNPRAIRDFNKAIELNPTDADSFWLRSMGYDFLGMLERASLDSEKARKLSSSEGDGYFTSGIILGINGQKNAQVEMFISAAKLGHKNAQEWLTENGYDWKVD